MARPPSANKPTYDELKAMYVDQDMSLAELATKLGRSIHTIKIWVQRYGIRKPAKRVAWLDDAGEAIAQPKKASEPKVQLVLDARAPKRQPTPPVKRDGFYPVESHRGKLPLYGPAKRLPAEQQAKVGRLLVLAKLWYAERRIRG